MSGPYVNDSGDVWVERGMVKWKDAYREASSTIGDPWFKVEYVGIVRDVLVADHEEAPCEAASEAHVRGEAPTCKCCRTIEAYHFRQADR